MPVCENDKKHGERQQNSTLFSGIAWQIRHVRVWTTAGHSRLCFFTSLRATEHFLSRANTQQQDGEAGNIGMSHLAEASESVCEIPLGRALSGNQGCWMHSCLWGPLTSQDKGQAKDEEGHGDNCTHWHLLLTTRTTLGGKNIPFWMSCWGFQLYIPAADHCETSGKLIFHQPQWRGAQTFVLLLGEGALSRARC